MPSAVESVAVDAVREEWLVEDRWWTPRPLRRRYFELVLADGRNVVVFCEPAQQDGSLVPAKSMSAETHHPAATDAKRDPAAPRRDGREAEDPAPPRRDGRRSGVSGGSYVELHCHSAYSFLDGASTPEELARAAARAGLSGPRPDRPRRRLGGDGVRAGLQVVRRSPDRRRRADRGCRGRPLSPDAPRRGRHRVAEPLPAGHRGSSRNASGARTASPSPPPCRWPRSSSGRRAWSASPAARATGRWRGASAAGAAAGRRATDAAAREALGRRLVGAFGRDRFRVELQRPFWRSDRARNRWLEDLAGRLGVRCVATGDVHMHDPSRAPLQDALVAVRLKGTLEETEPGRRGNGFGPPRRAGDDGRPLRRAPGRGRGEPRGSPSGSASTSPATSATATRARRTPTPTGRWPRSAGPGSITGTRASPSTGRARQRLEEELEVIRSLRLSGFFLLHFDILELAREVAAEVRGPDSLRGAPPPGPGPRLERQLDRLLPHRALACRPGAQRAVPGALPERGDHRGAGHRPRLSARHPREADSPRPRALRRGALGAGRGVRLLPVARRHPRLRQGAGPAAGRGRASGPHGRPVRPPRVGASRTWGRRSARSEPRRCAGRRLPAWRATRGGSRAIPPSIPAGW